MRNSKYLVWQYFVYFTLFFIQLYRRIFHLMRHLHLKSTTNAGKRKLAASCMVSLEVENDTSVSFFNIGDTSLADTYLSYKVR